MVLVKAFCLAVFGQKLMELGHYRENDKRPELACGQICLAESTRPSRWPKLFHIKPKTCLRSIQAKAPVDCDTPLSISDLRLPHQKPVQVILGRALTSKEGTC